jgi:hypothetical protein
MSALVCVRKVLRPATALHAPSRFPSLSSSSGFSFSEENRLNTEILLLNKCVRNAVETHRRFG